MKAGRTLFRRLCAGGVFAALPLPALAALGATPSWAVYGFFAFVAVVVIVLLLHEVLDDESPPEGTQSVKSKRAEPATPRYAAKHGPDNGSSLRRTA